MFYGVKKTTLLEFYVGFFLEFGILISNHVRQKYAKKLYLKVMYILFNLRIMNIRDSQKKVLLSKYYADTC